MQKKAKNLLDSRANKKINVNLDNIKQEDPIKEEERYPLDLIRFYEFDAILPDDRPPVDTHLKKKFLKN